MTDWIEKYQEAVVKYEKLKNRVESLIDQARKEERDKVLALLVDEDSLAKTKVSIDGGNVYSGSLFQRIEARNQLRSELRQQIKEMG